MPGSWAALVTEVLLLKTL